MPKTAEQLTADIAWAQKTLSGGRVAKYKEYREYYEGKQNLAFATDKFQQAFATLFETFAYNRCGSVIDATADRLRLHGFTTVAPAGSKPASDDVNQKTIDLIWRANRMDKKIGDFIREALLTGDGYLIVWPELQDSGELIPTFYVNSAEYVVVKYDDDTKKPLSAVKLWQIQDGPDIEKWRINLYYPDEIYKYITPDKKGDAPKTVGEVVAVVPNPELVALGIVADEPWPLPNPWGVIPVFHYGNRVRDGMFGRSELQDVLPLQDALNKACTDLMVAMEFGAYPQRWATGLQLGLPDPVTGKIPSPFKQGPGEVWSAPKEAGFGDFGVTDITQFIAVQDSLDRKISNVARIPTHWLNMGLGEAPSGEALKTAEAPFTGKLGGLSVAMGDTLEDSFSLALKQYGKPDQMLEANWANLELRSESDRAAVAVQRKQYGYSDEELQRQDGLKQEEIDRMKEENAAAVEEQQAAFSAGLGTGVPPGGGNSAPGEGQLPGEAVRSTASATGRGA
jgi:Phage portal protein, SPP1 Gp6-like